ncbi:fatty acyl-AMP ligase [Actinacidiphila sp. bgisy145]|uniref:fatty acyl-AMP ligase n=1 Tax=Actinacidiphila sp. bgisy145 TaxID=3413792 RepID=UPI003EBA6E08
MARSLVDLLTEHAARNPGRTAYRYLVTGDVDGGVEEITYGRLAERARAIAAWLQDHGLAGSRAVLLYPPGVEFICGYLGCLAAGVVAVPAVPPQGRAQNHRALARTERLLADADARAVLGGREVIAALRTMADQLPGLDRITCLATEDVPDGLAATWRAPDLTADSVAFLQYTSGSTSAPRGVMVTHGNLMHNERFITERMGHTPEALERHGHELFVSWLPLYHDMGLIGPVLNTVYLGATATLFSPLHFLQQPRRWAAAVSRYRPHTSGGPNFGYELSVKHATPDFVAGLDLSSWRVAFNGAEPVRAATLRRFTATFAPAGFRDDAHCPCYGLAEATLMVSGNAAGTPPVVAAGDGGSGPEAVGSGRPGPDMTVVIVDPERGAELPDGETGEIWVRSASVAGGYWRNALATRAAFRATLPGREGRFLRTGDLGFLRDGELFIAGRLKDLMVVDGRNRYPQDLELSAESAHPAVRPGCTAAFCVDGGADGEQPVLVAEVSADAAGEAEKIADLVRGAIGEAHGLPLHDVVLIRPGTIPKTSSGKIQRHATRAAYLGGTLSLSGASAG